MTEDEMKETIRQQEHDLIACEAEVNELRATGRESSIHWNKWACYRGAKADAISKTATK